MTGIFEWSATAASNAAADAEINWAEGQPANTVNNSARAMMRRVRQFLDDQFGALVTAGTGNAYTVTTNTAITTLRDGYGFVVRANRTCTGACTLNPDSKGDLPWRDEKGNEFQSGDIVAEGYYQVYYHASDTTYRTRLQASRSNPHGGAVLEFTNSSTITLKPKNDGFLRVGGAAKSVPSTGITGAATGKQTPINTTNSSSNGATAVFTLGATHSFVVGQKVLVASSSGNAERDPAFVGLKTVTAVTGTTVTVSPVAVTLGSSADTGQTLIGVWYVYAYDVNSDGVLDTLDISATGHTTDAFGVEVKSGDTTRVLVGMVAINSSGGTPIFADDTTRRYVRSYYNRQKALLKTKATAQVTTGSVNTVEANAVGLRAYFLAWADDLVAFDQVGEGNITASTGAAILGFHVDGVGDQDSSTRIQGANLIPAVAAYRGQFAEGLHSIGVSVNVSLAGTTFALGATAESLSGLRHFQTMYGAVL
jgi:hypothetical protein